MPTIHVPPPVGMQTTEGVDRVNKAIDHFNHTAHNVANLVSSYFDEWELVLKSDTDKHEVQEILDAMKERREAQEDFLRAVAGYPPLNGD